MSTLINRDPFARSELHRNRVYGINRCDWCGQLRHKHIGGTFAQTPDGGNEPKLPADGFYLYAYEVQTDGGSINPIKGLFCSVDCMRTYHS